MRRLAVIFVVWTWACPAPAFAQDLFELEVFPYETAAAGETSFDFHPNGIPGNRAPRGNPTIDHPFHVAVEVSHGWTGHFETGVFLQVAPVVRPDGQRFAGGHIRPKYRFSRPPHLPFDVSLAVEYGMNRTAFDENRQTLEIVPILERRAGRMSVVANPEWSMTIKGPERASPPKLSAAAKVAWQAAPDVSAGAEYYWKTEALKHFNQDTDRHHLLLPVMDVRLSPDWRLNLGAGRCLSDRNERWVLKTTIGYRVR